jgi:Ca2+-binding EF-hand superfamily protein
MNRLPAYGTLDQESAKQLAHRIFEIYDKDQSGAIESYEIGQMMIDTYSSINKHFVPSQYDIETYIKVLDKDGDGRVTLPDVEAMVVRMMCGNNK